MTKFLKAAPVLIAMALSLAMTMSLSAQPPATPKTTDVLVMLTIKPGVDRAAMMKTMPQEVRDTVRLYLDGKIRQWFSRSDGKGVMFIVPAADVAEAKAVMETLPLAKEGLADYEYIALSPLAPLGALLGPPPAGK